VIQDVFRVIPESLDPINMVLHPSATDERFRMVDRMMFPIPFQGLIATKRIRAIDGSLSRLGLDMPHQFVRTHRSTTLV